MSSRNESNALASSLAAQNYSFTYWESTEAKNLFRPLDDETVQKAIDNQIEALTEVHQQYNGYLDIIENIEEIDETELSDYQIWSIRQKSQFLALSLTFAKEHMNNWTWEKCCQTAVEHMKQAGINHAKNACTIMEWYRNFCETRTFMVSSAKHNLPPFLQQNPDICSSITTYTKEHLAELSIELLSEYIHETIVPKLVSEILEEDTTQMSKEQCEKEVKTVLNKINLPVSVHLLSID